MIDQKNSAHLDFAQLDLDRLKRRGVGEVVFGEGKSPAEIAIIMSTLVEAQGMALCTRVSKEAAEHTKEYWDKETSGPDINYLKYIETARCLLWRWRSGTRTVSAPPACHRAR